MHSQDNNPDTSSSPSWKLFDEISADSCDQIWLTSKDAYILKTQSLSVDLSSAYRLAGWIIPVACWVLAEKQQRDECMVLGVNGAQGSGKTTFCELLTVILEASENLKVCGFSIDDIYLTLEERIQLSQNVQSLLRTRGVPGTHDVKLGIDTIKCLQTASGDTEVAIPAFNKEYDDRAPLESWKTWKGPCDVIIFEGWCVGALPSENLNTAINDLEKNEDGEGLWRSFVNDALMGPYNELFGLIDKLVMIKAPSFECVLNWRDEQERKLEQKLELEGNNNADLKIMNRKEIERFIAHYERITRDNFSKLAPIADVLVKLDEHRTHIETTCSEQEYADKRFEGNA